MTLAEAIVVLTLIGLLAGFSIPRFLEPTPASIVTEEAELLAWTVRLARYRAITLGQPIYFELEPHDTTNSYTAYTSMTDPPAATAGGAAKTRIPFPDVVGGMPGRTLSDRLAFEPIASRVEPPVNSAIDLRQQRIGFDTRGSTFWPDARDAGIGLVVVRHRLRDEIRAVTVSRRGDVRVWNLTEDGWQ